MTDAEGDDVRRALASAAAHAGAGKTDDAEQDLLRAYQAHPNSPDIVAGLASLTRQLGRLDDAAAWLDRAVALAPDEPAHIGNLGNVYRALGRYDDAIDCYERVIAAMPGAAGAHNNLGLVLKAKDDLDGAVRAYRRALALAPESAEAQNNLGVALLAQDRAADALPELQAAVAARPDFIQARVNLGAALQRLGREDEALTAYVAGLARFPDAPELLRGLGELHLSQRRWSESLTVYRHLLELRPGDPVAARIVDALAGGSVSDAMARYVGQVFDDYAETFDRHLVETLGYRAPETLVGLAADHLAPRRLENVLDLGCGTGLVGEALKARFDIGSLVGVDLSPRMIAQADAKKVYDRLETAEGLAFLQQTGDRFDLVAACDVFIYLGDLEPLFEAVRSHLSRDGHFCFTIENGPDAGFTLGGTGRYSHAPSYIRDAARAHGFSEVAERAGEIRRERGLSVAGSYYLFSAG